MACCSDALCERPAAWESYQPGHPDSIRPLCQPHAEETAARRLSGNVDYPVVQLAGL